MKKKPAPCSCGQPRRKPWHLACVQCWALVPAPLQNEVFRLFKAERGSALHIAAVKECHRAILKARGVTAPHQLCQRPYGLPCLAHKSVISGDVLPCVNCEPYLEKTRNLLGTVATMQSGHGGVDKEGRIVDRREQPDAMPMPANDLFSIPQPKGEP